jgi:hypothetical protein
MAVVRQEIERRSDEDHVLDAPRGDTIALARPDRAALGVYAVAVGAASAVPVPFVDEWFGQLARGSALRRVARRHGVRLTPGARKVLSASLSPGARGALPRRVLGAVVRRAFAPLRIAARFEDAVATILSSVMLDHYLRHAGRREGQTMTEAEADRLRRAMDSAEVQGALDALRDTPSGVRRAVRDAVRSAFDPDIEDRSPGERIVDALLDVFADAPDELSDRLCAALDRALAVSP